MDERCLPSGGNSAGLALGKILKKETRYSADPFKAGWKECAVDRNDYA